MVAILQNTLPDFSELKVGPTSKVCSIDQATIETAALLSALLLGPTNAIWTVRVFDKVLPPNLQLYAKKTTHFSITLQ